MRGTTLVSQTRIRRFNTADTCLEQKLANDPFQVVVARGAMVFVGGQIGQVFPVSTGIAVSALARPDWLVEIDAIAVIPDAG